MPGWIGSAPNQTFQRGNGVYTGPTTFQQTEAAARGIRADDMDTHENYEADGINACVKKDGGNTLTASIPAGGFGMTGMGVLGSATEASITSASTADLLGSAALFNLITGTVTITSLGTGTNRFKIARFSGALTLTHNATSLILPGAANITTTAGDVMGVTSDASSNARVVWYQRTATAGAAATGAVLPGYIFGLTLSNNVSDATNDIDIATGFAADSSGYIVMNLASGLTKRLDASWAVGTNQGGLDTGSIANAWYYIWLIQRSDTGVVDALFSTSATAPTMPSNYDRKRRIGAIQRTGGAIRTFVQLDDHFLWLVPPQDYNTVNPGTNAVTPTLTIPVTGVDADISVTLIDLTPAAATTLLVTSPLQTNSAPGSLGYGNLFLTTSGAGVPSTVTSAFRVTTSSGTMRFRLDASTADHAVQVFTNGFWDMRGRLS